MGLFVYLKQICVFKYVLGYEQPKGDSEGLGLEIQQWNVEQKKPEKQYRIFQPFLPKVPVTLNF